MSKQTSSDESSHPPESPSSEIGKRRSAAAGLEEEASIKETANPEVEGSPANEEDLFSELSDPTNSTRLTTFKPAPRNAPDPLSVDLGETYTHELPEAEEQMLVDLNPKPGTVVVEKQAPSGEPKAPRKRKEGPAKPTKRQERKRVRQERRVQKKKEEEEKKAREAELEKRALAGSAGSGTSTGLDSTEGPAADEFEDKLSFDDLDMENPLPEAAYAPERDHAHLIMDRKQRRLEAVARAEQKEKEQHEIWEQDEEADPEKAQTRKQFNLPVYLIQAVFVVLGGFLLVLGVRIALKSTQDAEVGETLALEDTPGLKALGWLEAEEVLRKFLAAPGWEAKLAYVRNPEVARPRMARFYTKHPGEDQAIPSVTIKHEINHLRFENGSGFSFTCETDHGVRFRVPVVRFENEAPFFVVDWESFVAYSELEWIPFLEAKEPGSRGIFRLWVRRDDFYGFSFEQYDLEGIDLEQIDHDTFEFERHRQYYSLQLADPNREMSAYGYVKKGTPDWREIDTSLIIRENRSGIVRRKPGGALLMRDSTNWIRRYAWAPMVLEVEFPQEVTASYVPQLRITRFLSPNWVVRTPIPQSKAPEAP